MKPYQRSLRKDLTGKKFGMLTVLSLNGRDKGGRAMWLCKCECGEQVVSEGYNLQSGHTASCGCVRFTEKYGRDIIGVKSGRATVLRQYTDERNHVMVECQCDCGKIFSTHRMSFVRDTTQSCGCYQRDRSIEGSFKHGMTGTRMHGIWSGLKSRCILTTNHSYKNYGGRGITVCDEWLCEDGFNKFYEWSMANGYNDNLTIDRIDNSIGYTPDNCRWVDMTIQCNNTRRNIHIEYRGETKTMAKWARLLGLNYSKVYRRIYKLGWSADDAFSK